MLRLIQEIAPDWIVGENVLGLTNWNGGVVFEEVCVDLEDKGYEVQPYILPASSKNAPHKRDRVWFVAHSDNKGRSTRHTEVQEEDGKVSKWNDNAEFSNSNNGNVTDSSSFGRGRGNFGQEADEKQERKMDKGIGQHSDRIWCETPRCSTDATNTNNWGGSSDSIQTRRQKSNELYDTPQNATNSDSRGTQTRKHGAVLGESDSKKQARGFVDESLQGTTTNTNNTRTRESMRTNGEWEKEDKGWEGQSQFEYRENGKYGNVTNTDSRGLEGAKEVGWDSFDVERKGEFRDITDTDRGESECNWENFPTQPPVCGGDDGISTELDGITFPKWRRESIKGYGNAIVPQVVYSIFKTIEKYESTIKES
jgi:DNA (cytosine-5)-methyltransferase 1